MNPTTFVDTSNVGLVAWNHTTSMHRHCASCEPGKWLVRLDPLANEDFPGIRFGHLAGAVVDDYGNLVPV